MLSFYILTGTADTSFYQVITCVYIISHHLNSIFPRLGKLETHPIMSKALFITVLSSN